MKSGNQLLSSEPCPCDNCGQREVCADFDLACSDFALYSYSGINTLHDRTATRERYLNIFREVESV